MISRRNIRVKVMQALYTVDSMGETIKPGEPERILDAKIESSKKLFTYLIYFITETARYAEKDAMQRASKNLPSAQDLAVNIKIAGNELLWKIRENVSFSSLVNQFKVNHLADDELIKKTYQSLTNTAEYKDYIETEQRQPHTEKAILEFIFTNLILPDEDTVGFIEENFINWDDDSEMMNLMVQNFLQKPHINIVQNFISSDKLEFAKQLLVTVLDKQEHSLELIKPKLNNWEADRIAALDLIILQMGLCELLYFDTIPTKVTINEYIDLAKEYSTPQSGNFVNGVLDNLHKDLTKQDKIHKVNFK